MIYKIILLIVFSTEICFAYNENDTFKYKISDVKSNDVYEISIEDNIDADEAKICC